MPADRIPAYPNLASRGIYLHRNFVMKRSSQSAAFLILLLAAAGGRQRRKLRARDQGRLGDAYNLFQSCRTMAVSAWCGAHRVFRRDGRGASSKRSLSTRSWSTRPSASSWPPTKTTCAPSPQAHPAARNRRAHPAAGKALADLDGQPDRPLPAGGRRARRARQGQPRRKAIAFHSRALAPGPGVELLEPGRRFAALAAAQLRRRRRGIRPGPSQRQADLARRIPERKEEMASLHQRKEELRQQHELRLRQEALEAEKAGKPGAGGRRQGAGARGSRRRPLLSPEQVEMKAKMTAWHKNYSNNVGPSKWCSASRWRSRRRGPTPAGEACEALYNAAGALLKSDVLKNAPDPNVAGPALGMAAPGRRPTPACSAKRRHGKADARSRAGARQNGRRPRPLRPFAVALGPQSEPASPLFIDT